MIAQRHTADIVILSPRGAMMGGPETSEFRTTIEELLSKGLKKIVIDLKEVKWINAAGIGILVETLYHLREMKGDLRLARCCGRIGSIMSLLKIGNLFQYYETPDNAVASFA